MYAILTDENFSDEVLENATPVLVEIGADWCGGCHIMAPVLDTMAYAYSRSLKIGKLDAERNKDVPRRYGVHDLPTLLLFKDGQLVGRISGAVSQQTLEAQLQAKLLDGY